MKTLKPLLAETCSMPAALPFPMRASRKLDGIRCLIITGPDGQPLAVSRNLKPIPNLSIRATLAKHAELIGMDGELLTYTDGKMDAFNVVSSKVMSQDGAPEFIFHVFDKYDEDLGFEDRDSLVYDILGDHLAGDAPVERVEQVMVNNVAELDAFETLALTEGFEGVMVRKLDGRYKNGRSTEREAILLKIKRFADAEARVIGSEELMHNGNEAKVNALGKTERSSHKANLTGRNMLGALIVEADGHQFKIGTGFDERTRKDLWTKREKLIGQLVKFKHQPSGAKEAPRFPVFIGFRSPADL